MAIETKDTLKSYFETGKKPTQEQFASLIESLLHVSELLNLNLVKANSTEAVAGNADDRYMTPVRTKEAIVALTRLADIPDLATEVENRIDTAINALKDGVGGAYDTLKEIGEYIASDKSIAAALTQRIADLESSKEPAFIKNTAFNKDFGLGAGEVAEADKAFLHRVDYTTDDPLDFDSFLKPGSRNIYFNHNTYDANFNENGYNPNQIINNPLDIINDTFTAKQKRDLRGVLTVTIGGRPDNVSTIPITPHENYLVQNYYDYFHGHFYRVRYYTNGVFTSWKNAETSSAKIYTGDNAPSNSIGKLGDIYLQRNIHKNGGVYEGSSANRGTYVGSYNGVIWIKSWYPNGSGGTYKKWLKLPMTSA